MTVLWRHGNALLPFLLHNPEWPHLDHLINRANTPHSQEMVNHLVTKLGDCTDLINACTPDCPPHGQHQMLRHPNVLLVPGRVTGSLTMVSWLMMTAPSGGQKLMCGCLLRRWESCLESPQLKHVERSLSLARVAMTLFAWGCFLRFLSWREKRVELVCLDLSGSELDPVQELQRL